MTQAASNLPKEGAVAPDFTAQTTTGETVSLSQFLGKRVLLFFYPMDDTPGCTKEACGFRDLYSSFTELGVEVLGVSIDSVESHKKFSNKFKLPFSLVADPEKKIVQAYGVWGQKSFLGRKYMGTHRITFLIGRDGRIERVWPDVKASKHPAEVLAAIET